MISRKIADRINEQINREMASAYLYLGMSAKMAEKGYHGAAKWLLSQYHEEMFHAMKFYGYLLDQGASVELKTLPAPEVKTSDFKELFQKVLEHEKGVTKSIVELLAMAKAENDYATEIFVQWYVGEQVEEEKNASEILQNLDLLGGSSQALFLLNLELGKRVPEVATSFLEVEGAH